MVALIVKNKTPWQLCYSLIKESEKGLRRVGLRIAAFEKWINTHDPKRISRSPFSRSETPPAHSPQILNIPTSEFSGEAAHPDVLYIPEGWGAGGWTWLMTATPYPSGNDYFENPEFYVSYDGIEWEAPADALNPLTSVPLYPERRDIFKEYHSDPSLLMNRGVLHLYYRWTGVLRGRKIENRLRLMTSNDGLSWSSPIDILKEQCSAGADRKFLSPSVLLMNGKYFMWTVEYENGQRSIFRRTSPDGLNWDEPYKSEIAMPEAVSNPWHLDVIAGSEGLFLMLTTAKDRGIDAELYCGYSEDCGISWNITEKPFKGGYFFEGKRIYRSSLVLHDNRLRLYYSAMSSDGTWNIAILKDLAAKTFFH